jgi:hypothetical protein
MTINDPINGSTPPHILEAALSGQLARQAGAEGLPPLPEDTEAAQETPEAPQEVPVASEPADNPAVADPTVLAPQTGNQQKAPSKP